MAIFVSGLRNGPDDNADYFYLKQDTDGDLLEDSDGDDWTKDGSESYVVCSICGAIAPEQI